MFYQHTLFLCHQQVHCASIYYIVVCTRLWFIDIKLFARLMTAQFGSQFNTLRCSPDNLWRVALAENQSNLLQRINACALLFLTHKCSSFIHRSPKHLQYFIA